MSADPTFSVKANVVQFMAEPSGLIGADGHIKSNLALKDGHGITLAVPIQLFPFLKPGIGVLVTLSVVQIQPEEPVIAPAQKLILPN